MNKFCISVVMASLVLSACVPKTNRVEVASDDSFSTETSSKDLLSVSEKMVASILSLRQISSASKPPKIAFSDVQNETNEIINKNLFIERMRTLLIKNASGRLIFLDREIGADIESERENKREGELSMAKQAQKLGADFFLTGKLSSIDKVSGSKRSTYTRYAFRLTDAETTAIIWEDDYEVKKVGQAPVYDR